MTTCARSADATWAIITTSTTRYTATSTTDRYNISATDRYNTTTTVPRETSTSYTTTTFPVLWNLSELNEYLAQTTDQQSSQLQWLWRLIQRKLCHLQHAPAEYREQVINFYVMVINRFKYDPWPMHRDFWVLGNLELNRYFQSLKVWSSSNIP